MSDRRTFGRFAAASAIALCVSACRAPAASPPAGGAPTAASPAAAASGSSGSMGDMPGMPGMAMPHGDHNPHHGGIVMMKGDMHYEVVLDPSGHSHQLYFTDATRQDLPASIASTAALTIHRPDGSDEAIPMQIDEAGESWIGSGRPVGDPTKTMVRVAFTIANEPYWIDLPFEQPPAPK